MIKKKQFLNTIRFLLCSFLGIFLFFIKIPINGESTIILDYLVSSFRNLFNENTQKLFVLFFALIGVICSFINKSWKNAKKNIAFTIIKILGFLLALMYYFRIGPSFLLSNRKLLPYLFDTLCISLSFLVPIGTIALSFLTKYGLLEFTSVFMQPIMKKIWKIPGESAIDVLVSFLGSYSIALLITENMYLNGKYNKKESFIIATGFSSISSTFIYVICKTLNIMEYWTGFFIATVITLFLTTTIVIRLFPTSKVSTDYYENTIPNAKKEINKNKFKIAWNMAIEASSKSNNVFKNTLKSVKDGIIVTSNIIPTIMFVGLIGIAIAEYTPIFDILGYLFYPVAYILRIPEALTVSKISSMFIVDMFFPILYSTDLSLKSRFIIGVVSVSELLFFSSVIPCILSTKIPVKIWQIVVIWIERTIISLVIATLLSLVIL